MKGFAKIAILALAFVLVLGVIGFVAQPVLAVSGAVSTTDNPGFTGPGSYVNQACLNGQGVNCNLYLTKMDVWFSGLPVSAALGAGTYFFAVLVPGGQPNPNDGGAKNLSDTTCAPYAGCPGPTNSDGSNVPSGDAYTNRTFTVDGSGNISYSGTHSFDAAHNKLQLFPYDDTTNPGGVYIMAVCSLGSNGTTYPVDPSDCKYDAFKVKLGTTPGPVALTVVKDATPSFDKTYKWDDGKAVDKTLVKQVGGNATFTYTVTVSHDNGTAGNWQVNGTITVFNPNDDPVTGVDITDSVDNGGTCVVTGGTGLTVPGNDSVSVTYKCTYSSAPSPAAGTNTATATWPTQQLSNGQLNGGSATFPIGFDFGSVSPNLIDNCVTVTDTFDGKKTTLGTVCVGDPNPKTFIYSHTVPVPQFACVSYTNTTDFTTNTTGAHDPTPADNTVTVTVCGPLKTGALTMGFWQNKNGQGIITGGASTGGVCNSGTWLRQFAPFQDLSATATCSQVASYFVTIFKAANAGGSTMNAMLKAQMLATALDVYFSDPALGGNKIGAPAPIGGVTIDLTNIGGSENVSAAFGGATSMTVMQMLTYAASQSNSGGTVWYGQIKATQGLAKDAFDAINNQKVFGP